MAGVMTAEVKHVRIMLVAVAPPIPLVTPTKRRAAMPKRIPTAPPVHPLVASRKCHACHALGSRNG
eukprot:4051312-Pyramimonas_sp.AAC.1